MRYILLLILCAIPTAAAASGPICAARGAAVCALKSDGTRSDFSNACAAAQAGAKILHAGQCAAPGNERSMCNMLYQPVC
ncbi:MAG: hypothetical protein JOY77_12230, partial [Alphaproteobacteria bacterium]|nr:hypothetical protein [Alphaproteobacteria bacterium]